MMENESEKWNQDLQPINLKNNFAKPKPAVKLENTNRNFRKKLSEFVIKRNQKLTNSRYATMIEKAHQEHPSKKTYYYDPTFTFQL